MRTSYEVNKELKDVEYKIDRLKKIYEDCEKKYGKASLMMQLCQYALEKFEFDIESATATEIENAKDMSTFQDFAISEYEKANIEKIKYEYAFRDATRDMEPLKGRKKQLEDEWRRAKREEDPQMAIPMN